LFGEPVAMSPRPKAVFSSGEARSLISADVSEALSVGEISPPVGCAFEAAKTAKGLAISSARAGAAVLANTLLGGSGLLAVPHAFASAGWALGLVFLLVFAFCSALGCHLLQCSARRIGEAPSSFYSVSNAVAPRWTWLVDGAVMIKCFGVATSYLIIVGDLAPPAFETLGFRSLHRWQIILLGFAIAGSLACFKNISKLKCTAVGAIVIVIWTTVLIALYAVRPTEELNPCDDDEDLPCNGASFVPVVTGHPLALGKALPVFIFAFTCQQNIFSICNEVKNATRGRVDRIICAAYLMSGVAFVLAALLGYLTFGDQIESDILKGYPEKSSIVAVTRLLYCLLALFSYPLQIHPSRTSALALMDLVRPSASGGASRWAAVTVLELAGSLIIAITVLDLGKILAVVGATGSTMVSYILPGLVYAQAFKEFHAKRVLAIGLLLLGCIVMPTCLTLIFL